MIDYYDEDDWDADNFYNHQKEFSEFVQWIKDMMNHKPYFVMCGIQTAYALGLDLDHTGRAYEDGVCFTVWVNGMMDGCQ